MANPIITNTDTDETLSNAPSLWGRQVVVGLSGTFDSATATLRYKVGTDVCVFDQTDEPAFTQGGGVTVTIPQGATALRINTAGGLGSTSITYTYTPVRTSV
jgi:predicted porin